MNLSHLSFSQLSSFESCPKLWYCQKVLNEQQPASSAASRGSQFDQAVACKLGLVGLADCDSLYDKKTNQAIQKADRLDEAVEVYLANGGWTNADEAQKEVRMTSDQWDTLAGMYDVDWPLPLPIVGYIDLFRRTSGGLRSELCDIKTSERAEFRAGWSLQCTLYSLIERAYRYEVHLVTFTKQIKLHKYVYHPTQATYKWAMNRIGWLANQLMEVSKIRSVDSVPAVAGYHCGWCPRQLNCEAAVAGRLVTEGANV